MHVTQKMIAWLKQNDRAAMVPVARDADQLTKDLVYSKQIGRLLYDGKLDSETLASLSDDESESETMPSASEVFGQKNTGQRIRVKDSSESYSEKRFTATNKQGRPAADPFYGGECETLSEAAAARHGVLFKHLANRSGLVSVPLSEHERGLLGELTTEKTAWCGKIGGEHVEDVSGLHCKQLIDDAVSGGLEIVPIEFDRDVISFPLLHSELLPQVDVKPVPRGRRIEGASLATPTMTWGGGDSTNIALFDTTAMTQPIDTTIFVVDGAVEVGRDFMGDSPVEVGNLLTQLVGERLSAELDIVLATGNGTTRPEGLFTAAGVTTINAANGGAGPPSVADYLSLLFSLPKQYRTPAMRAMFVGNDVSYQRAKSIAVDVADDQRLVLGMHADAGSGAAVENYSVLGRPFKIVNAINNRSVAFAALSRYRLYRRAGLEVRWEGGGQTLARRNTILLIFRARFGGRLMDANAAAKWIDGQV